MKRVINENEANHRKYISDLKRKSKHIRRPPSSPSSSDAPPPPSRPGSNHRSSNHKGPNHQGPNHRDSFVSLLSALVGLSIVPFDYLSSSRFSSARARRLRRRRIAGSFLSSSICQQERGETPKLRAGPGTGSQQKAKRDRQTDRPTDQHVDLKGRKCCL